MTFNLRELSTNIRGILRKPRKEQKENPIDTQSFLVNTHYFPTPASVNEVRDLTVQFDAGIYDYLRDLKSYYGEIPDSQITPEIQRLVAEVRSWYSGYYRENGIGKLRADASPNIPFCGLPWPIFLRPTENLLSLIGYRQSDDDKDQTIPLGCAAGFFPVVITPEKAYPLDIAKAALEAMQMAYEHRAVLCLDGGFHVLASGIGSGPQSFEDFQKTGRTRPFSFFRPYSSDWQLLNVGARAMDKVDQYGYIQGDDVYHQERLWQEAHTDQIERNFRALIGETQNYYPYFSHFNPRNNKVSADWRDVDAFEFVDNLLDDIPGILTLARKARIGGDEGLLNLIRTKYGEDFFRSLKKCPVSGEHIADLKLLIPTTSKS